MTPKQIERMNELAEQDRKMLVPQDGYMEQRTYCRGYEAAHNDATAIIEKLERVLKTAEDRALDWDLMYQKNSLELLQKWRGECFEALAELNKWRECV